METVQEQGIDALASLEQRITRAVELITTLRAENDQLLQRLNATQQDLASVSSQRDEAHAFSTDLQRQNGELEQKLSRFSQELDELRSERRQVKARIEKLLGQMELVSAS